MSGRFLVSAGRNRQAAILELKRRRQRVDFSAACNCWTASSIRPSGQRRQKKKDYVIKTHCRRVGVEFDCAAEAGFRLAPLSVARVGHSECVMSLLQQRVQLNGPFGRRAHLHQFIRFGATDACQVSVVSARPAYAGAKAWRRVASVRTVVESCLEQDSLDKLRRAAELTHLCSPKVTRAGGRKPRKWPGWAGVEAPARASLEATPASKITWPSTKALNTATPAARPSAARFTAANESPTATQRPMSPCRVAR